MRSEKGKYDNNGSADSGNDAALTDKNTHTLFASS